MIEQWQVSAPEERTGSPRGDWCTMALLLLELEILWLGSSFLRCLAITRACFRGATNEMFMYV